LGPGPTEEYWEQRYDIALDYRDEVQHLPRKERWRRRRWGFDYLHMALPASRVLDYRKRASDLLFQRGIEVREYAVWGRPELFSMLVRPASDQLESAGFADAVDDVLRLAQDMGGTMEYCHGAGIKLAHLLAREWGVGLDVVRSMKQALDPANIMNPGKLGL
jgi:FAD/FMN-containing dehydrogenase